MFNIAKIIIKNKNKNRRDLLHQMVIVNLYNFSHDITTLFDLRVDKNNRKDVPKENYKYLSQLPVCEPSNTLFYNHLQKKISWIIQVAPKTSVSIVACFMQDAKETK